MKKYILILFIFAYNILKAQGNDQPNVTIHGGVGTGYSKFKDTSSICLNFDLDARYNNFVDLSINPMLNLKSITYMPSICIPLQAGIILFNTIKFFGSISYQTIGSEERMFFENNIDYPKYNFNRQFFSGYGVKLFIPSEFIGKGVKIYITGQVQGGIKNISIGIWK